MCSHIPLRETSQIRKVMLEKWRHIHGSKHREALDKHTKKKNEMNKEDPTQSIPDWLQPFTYDLEDLETHVLAHSSERDISDSESDAWKVETHTRKYSIYTHFPKDRNCDICLRTQIERVSWRRRNKGSFPWSEKFGDLTTADHSPWRK